ncbi:MAG: hypothetical protein AAF125_28465, partial [Chloroflexota bacterium]
LAEEAREAEPVLGVERGAVPGADGVAALRARGYNGLTLTGYDPMTDAPPSWHAQTDVLGDVDISGVERAVHFIRTYAMILDSKALR